MMLMTFVLLLFTVFNVLHLWGFRFYSCFFPSLHKFILAEWNKWRTRASAADCKAIEVNVTSQEEICMDEVNTVMHRLGLETDRDAETWNINNIAVTEFTEIFLDEAPSLVEIKQVFQVFDVNGDGFIDPTELQRVLCGLCMREGSKLEDCRKMVSAFDGNGDGLIDFEEFVVVMENCFS